MAQCVVALLAFAKNCGQESRRLHQQSGRQICQEASPAQRMFEQSVASKTKKKHVLPDKNNKKPKSYIS